MAEYNMDRATKAQVSEGADWESRPGRIMVMQDEDKGPSLLNELTRLDEKIDTLGKLLSGLGQRLEPILGHYPTDGGESEVGNSKMTRGESELTARVQQTTERLQGIVMELANLSSRVQL